MNTRDDRGAGDLDRQSRPEPALSPGAHVVSPRTGYSHHGIYVGGGRVVHYRGFERGLVSQFIRQAEDRSHFFGQIAQRLSAGGVLINSDLVLGTSPPVHQSLFEVWLRMLGGSGWSEEDIEKMRASWRLHIAALTPPEIEAVIAAGGFDTPVLFFQTLFIHAWFSKRTASG